MIDLLHGEVKADQNVVATWEAQPVTETGGWVEWEYAVDVEPGGVPQRYTGLFRAVSGTDLVVVAATAMAKAADYL